MMIRKVQVEKMLKSSMLFIALKLFILNNRKKRRFGPIDQRLERQNIVPKFTLAT